MESDCFQLIVFQVSLKAKWHTLHRIKSLHCLQVLFLLWTQIQSAAKHFNYSSMRMIHALLSCSRKTILNHALKGWAAFFLFNTGSPSHCEKGHADYTGHKTQLLKGHSKWKTKLVFFFVMSSYASCNLPLSPLIDLLWLFLACLLFSFFSLSLFFKAKLWFVCVFTNNSPPFCSGTFLSTS